MTDRQTEAGLTLFRAVD